MHTKLLTYLLTRMQAYHHAKPRPAPPLHTTPPYTPPPPAVCHLHAGPNAYTYTMDEADGVYACAVGTSYNETLCGCDEDATNPR